MATYSAFLPPGREGEAALERTRLVRDGFHFWAFLFGPFWFMRRGLWLAALLALVVWGMAFGLPALLRLDAGPSAFIGLALAWLLGLEASSLERWTLTRRGWRESALVVAANGAEAEARALDRLVAVAATAAPVVASSPAFAPGTAPMSPSVLGLFPDAGDAR